MKVTSLEEDGYMYYYRFDIDINSLLRYKFCEELTIFLTKNVISEEIFVDFYDLRFSISIFYNDKKDCLSEKQLISLINTFTSEYFIVDILSED